MKQSKKKEYEEFQQYLYNKAHGYIWTPDTLELICSVNDNDPERIGKQMLEMRGKLRNEHIAHMSSDKHKNYVIRSLRRDETDLLKLTQGVIAKLEGMTDEEFDALADEMVPEYLSGFWDEDSANSTYSHLWMDEVDPDAEIE